MSDASDEGSTIDDSEVIQDRINCSLDLFPTLLVEDPGQYLVDNTKNESENLIDLISILTVTTDLRDEISRNRDSAQSAWDEWSDLIKNTKDKAKREAEVQAYHEFKNTNNIRDQLTQAANKIRTLNKAISLLEKEKKLHENSIRTHIPAAPIIPPGTAPVLATNKSKLGKLPAKIFKGNIEEWSEFYEFFRESIENDTTLNDSERHRYLRGYLQFDDPKKNPLIGMPIDAAHFPRALATLKETFGKKDRLVEHLNQRLFALKATHKASDLRPLVDEFEMICKQMEALNIEVKTNGQIEHSFLVKLPKRVMSKILEIKREKGDTWNTDIFREELKRVVEIEQSVEENFAYLHPSNQSHNKKSHKFSAHINASVENKTDNCRFCNKQHQTYYCDTYKTSSERFERVKTLQLCSNCLTKGHSAKDCRSKKRCSHCQHKHNSSLCRFKDTQKTETTRFSRNPNSKHRFNKPRHSSAPTRKVVPNSSSENSTTTVASVNVAPTLTEIPHSSTNSGPVISIRENPKITNRQVLFLCTRSQVHNPHKLNTKIYANAFLDTFSFTTFIKDEIAEKLCLSKRPTDIEVGLFGSNQSTKMATNAVKIAFSSDFGEKILIEGYTKKFTTLPAPTAQITPEEFKSINQNEPMLNVTWLEPDIIIGQNAFSALKLQLIRTLASGYVVYSSSIGAFVGGYGTPKATPIAQPSYPIICAAVTNAFEKTEQSPETAIDDFFSLEGIGIESSELSFKPNEMTLNHFKNNIKHDGERFEVALPFIMDKIIDVKDCFGLAFGCLHSLYNKCLKKDPQLLKNIENIITEQKNLQIIEQIENPFESNSGTCPIVYIPFQCVFRSEKSFTKIRLVYNASARQNKNSPSLNQCLYKGPDLNSLLVKILLYSRLHKIFLTCDIEKAFLMISVRKEDRDCLRFLWLRDPSKPPSRKNLIVYRFCRVPFGAISSPFLLMATIEHLLSLKPEIPLTQTLINLKYMDNLCAGCQTPSEGIKLYQQFKELFKHAGMNVREFMTNSKELFELIPPEDRDPATAPKLLGIRWDARSDPDTFIIKLPKIPAAENLQKLLKRDVLAFFSKQFDPLGLTEPVKMVGKLFFQKLWIKDPIKTIEQKPSTSSHETPKEKCKSDWDTPLTETQKIEFLSLLSDWSKCSEFSVPRFIGEIKDDNCSLHAFCDASGFAKNYAEKKICPKSTKRN